MDLERRNIFINKMSVRTATKPIAALKDQLNLKTRSRVVGKSKITDIAYEINIAP